SALAEPENRKPYIVTQIRRLLLRNYPVEVGLSVIPIPLPYAVEREVIRTELGGGADAKLKGRILKPFFPMPRAAEIEDSIADATYRRRDQISLNNREFDLIDSVFWRRYEDFLASDIARSNLPKEGERDDWRFVSKEWSDIEELAQQNAAILEFEGHP